MHNTNKDYQWIKKHSSNFTVDVSNTSDKYGQLAIQGPHSRALINELVGYRCKPYGNV